jgi:Tol biopolymer transport system component/DNA-binding winged helix-turn-helix (wHTH) protein
MTEYRAATKDPLRFGVFEIDPYVRELRKHGVRIKLQDQPLAVLLILLEKPGQLVAKEELQQRLWPSDTFVEFDKGIYNALKRLRETLGDSADNPRYVETLPRRGYRFICPVEHVAEGPRGQEQCDTSDAEVVPGKSSEWQWRLVAVAACVALLAAAAATYHFWPRSKAQVGPARITQISRWNKPMNDAKLSPDGHAVAFVSPVGGIAQVFLMLTSGGEPLQLTNDEGDKDVDTFSPDGTEIYYERSIGREEVWAVPTLGGAPRRVVSGSYAVPSADGEFIYYVKADSFGLFRAGKSGLNEEQVYNNEGSPLFFIPLLLFPGSNDVLAAGERRDSPNIRFSRINVTRHEAVDFGEVNPQLTKSTGGDWNMHDVVWAEPGKTLLLSRTVNGLTNIWKYSLQDRSLTQITFGAGPDFSPMPDPGGKGIYLVNGKSSNFLTAYHVHSKQSTDIVSEDATEPAISPDGKRVMYIIPAGENLELWVSDINGGNKLKIATGDETLGAGTWASDNIHLSFNELATGTESKNYIVGADGSGLRELPPMGGTPANPVWSPDQKSLYVSVVVKGQLFNIWKWTVDSSSLEKVVDNCVFVQDADPGGQYLLGATWSGEKAGILEVSISERRCISLLPGTVTARVTFARDGKSFLYAVASRGEVTIFRQPWRDGKVVGAPQVALKVPFTFPLTFNGSNGYDISRDLSTIVYVRPGGHADLYLLSQK